MTWESSQETSQEKAYAPCAGSGIREPRRILRTQGSAYLIIFYSLKKLLSSHFIGI
jgi:hypothetical protein